MSLPDALAALERELAGAAKIVEREPAPSNGEPPAPAAAAAPAAEVRPLQDVLSELLLHLRGITRADAGTIFVRHGDTLRFTIVQNDFLTRQVGEAELRRRMQGLPLALQKTSIAGYVAVTGEAVNIADVYHLPPERDFRFNRAFDVRNGYRTRSVLAGPVVDEAGTILGVIELLNALDDRGMPVPFSPQAQDALRIYAARTACAIITDRTEARRAAVGTAMPAPAAEVPRVSPPLAQHLGEVLISSGMITRERLAEALAEQRRTNEKLGAILVRGGFLTDRELMDALSRQYGLAKVDLGALTIDPGVLALVPREVAREHSIVPVDRRDGSLRVATADPTDLAAFDAVGAMTGLNIVPVLAPVDEIHQAISRAYDTPVSGGDPLGGALEVLEAAAAGDGPPIDVSADEAASVRLVSAILQEAVRRGASDIHFESFAQTFCVRLRIDGVLSRLMTPPRRLQPAVVSRIKTMADLDVAEHRRPQDGRLRLRVQDRQLDARVSVVPTLGGESVNIRLLDGALLEPNLANLGFEPWELGEVTSALQQPRGVVLVTGPSGSGRTTTLYSVLHALNKQDVKILTLEDPVECAIEGINQVAVQEDIGRTFGAMLRVFLRHDPDVILVGELRDLETAQSALHAALTGHLVLSALPADDCASTVGRLVEMGIPSFLAAAALRLLVAQRLARKVCVECRRPYEATEESLAAYGHTPRGSGVRTLYRSVGCRSCGFTGMKGRIGIFEVMPITPGIAELILRNASVAELRGAARRQGMTTLREAGLLQALRGVTTVEEVLRVTSEQVVVGDSRSLPPTVTVSERR